MSKRRRKAKNQAVTTIARSAEPAASKPYQDPSGVKATEPSSDRKPAPEPKKKKASNFAGSKFSEMKPAWEKDDE